MSEQKERNRERYTKLRREGKLQRHHQRHGHGLICKEVDRSLSSYSVASSTVADPSKVTVRIENAPVGAIDVQDVSTSSSDTDDFDGDRRRKQLSGNRSSSAASRRRTSDREHHKSNARHTMRPSRLSTNPAGSMRLPQSRPITAVSLPGKTSAYDNEWDLESEPAFLTSNHRRNPSCPSISPIHGRSKQSSPVLPKFAHQPVPNIFTTTAQYLGNRPAAHISIDFIVVYISV